MWGEHTCKKSALVGVRTISSSSILPGAPPPHTSCCLAGPPGVPCACLLGLAACLLLPARLAKVSLTGSAACLLLPACLAKVSLTGSAACLLLSACLALLPACCCLLGLAACLLLPACCCRLTVTPLAPVFCMLVIGERTKIGARSWQNHDVLQICVAPPAMSY